MSTTEYKRENLRQFVTRLNVSNDKVLIDWIEQLKADKVSINKVITTAMYEFMEKHEFDDVEFLKEYIDKDYR